MWLFAVWSLFLALVAPGWAGQPEAPPPADMVTAKEIKDQLLPEKEDKDKTEEQLAKEEAERKKKEKLARVIVLQWNGRDTDYTDTTLQRNVRSRIGRPDAQFFPDVDLYQNGRKVRDKTVVPAMQPATVPDQNIARVMDAVDEAAALPERALRYEEWSRKARDLREMVELLWFVDRVELREPLFKLYAAIGRAAYFADTGQPPFFEDIGGFSVNYYYYLAALLAYQDPTLMSKIGDDEVRENIQLLLGFLKEGRFPTFTLDFELTEEDTGFDLEIFNKTYEVYINGILIEDIDENGQYQAFFGRNDIYLKRKDSGHGLSERLEATKLEDKIYFVRDTARKKMGLDFIRQLFRYENVCIPPLDGDILNYLAIYNKIHGNVDVFIAVPKYGNPNRTYIWRWDRERAQLQLVLGSGDSFPVRFAILASAGVMYNGADPSVDTSVEPSDVSSATETEVSDVVGRLSPNLAAASIPIDFQLRGHYNRLMVAIGAEIGINAGSEAQWVENYYTSGHRPSVVFDQADVEPITDEEGAILDDDGSYRYTVEDSPVYNEKKMNRLLYITHAVVLGKDAAIGLGPRIGLQVGWTNLPYALQTTLHAGWTLQMPGFEKATNRVRPIVDIDLRGGTSFPFRYSLSKDSHAITVDPLFGLTAGVGTTF